MSIIYQALRKMEAPETMAAEAGCPLPPRRRWLTPARWSLLLVLAVLGWELAGLFPSRSVEQTPGVSLKPLLVSAEAAPLPQPVWVPEVTAGPVLARPAPVPVRREAPAVVVSPVPQDVSVHINRFYQALLEERRTDAAQHLDILIDTLPEGSLTLLRARAWYAMTGEDNAQALALYRQLLRRVPDDHNASLNMAIVEMRVGEHPSAYQRLRALRARIGDSDPVLRQAIGRLLETTP